MEILSRTRRVSLKTWLRPKRCSKEMLFRRKKVMQMK